MNDELLAEYERDLGKMSWKELILELEDQAGAAGAGEAGAYLKVRLVRRALMRRGE
jgi:hypothetical protein